MLTQPKITYMDQLIFKAVNDDGWEFWVIHGPKGRGKTTLMLDLLFCYLRDWDKVFKHLIFLHTNLLTITEKVLEAEDIFNRCPILGWDDIGIYKSKWRYRDPSTIEFLEFFEGIREVLAVLITNSSLANKTVKGLREDLTASIFLPKRGWYIFQKHEHQDNYYGLTPRFRKIKMAEGSFPIVPLEQYTRYKILRRKVLIEMKVKRLRVLEAEDIMKKLNPIDKELLKYMYEKHDLGRHEFQRTESQAHFRGSLQKLEAYNLLNAEGNRVCITELGENIHLQIDPDAKELLQKLQNQ